MATPVGPGASAGEVAWPRVATTWRRAAGLAAGLLLLCGLGLATGAAASLVASSATLGAATAATPRCTTDGLTIFRNLTSGAVVSVPVGGIPAACGNASLQVTVHNGAAFSSGSAMVPGGGGTVTVTLAVPVAVTTSMQTDLVLVGP